MEIEGECLVANCRAPGNSFLAWDGLGWAGDGVGGDLLLFDNAVGWGLSFWMRCGSGTRPTSTALAWGGSHVFDRCRTME